MALDDYLQDEEEPTEDQTEEQGTDPITAREQIVRNMEHRVTTGNLDIEISDGEVIGDVDDVAMLFALMTMDMTESDFDKLITDNGRIVTEG